MGLLSFVKGVGAKILGDDEEKEAQATPTADPEVIARQQAAIVNGLKKAVVDMGFTVQDLDIEYDRANHRAAVSGTVDSQEVREKVLLTVGNTTWVAEVDDRITVVNPEPPGTYHTVVKGDTLWAISKKHYGKGNLYNNIFEANKPMLTDPNLIYPGQVLRIPPLAEQANA